MSQGLQSKFNSNNQFKDKIMENKSLELLGFHCGEAKKHAKQGYVQIVHKDQ